MQIPLSAPRVPVFCAPRGHDAYKTELLLHLVHSPQPYDERRVLHGLCFGEELPDIAASSAITTFKRYDDVFALFGGWAAEKPSDIFERWDDQLQAVLLSHLSDWQAEVVNFVELALPSLRTSRCGRVRLSV